MPDETVVTTPEVDLAETDQAAPAGQTNVWEQRYNGLQGKLQQTQRALSQTKQEVEDERTKWETDKRSFQDQLNQLRQALEAAEAEVSTLAGVKTNLTGELSEREKQQQALAAQLARQQTMLKYPQLVSDPVLKLVESSNLGAEELEAVLSGMAQGRQQIVEQVYQNVQSGATAPVGPTQQPGTTEEQAKAAWSEALAAMTRNDMGTYNAKYAEYLAILDRLGGSPLAKPATLSGPI